MQSRSTLFDYRKLSPATIDGLRGVSDGAKATGLDAILLELVKMRASQINGCAYCLAVHLAEARKLGMSEGALHLLFAWREAACFSERAPPWPGPRPSPWLPRARCRTRPTTRRAASSATPNWPI
jgi:AhpD family alkylhydroperoxidase